MQNEIKLKLDITSPPIPHSSLETKKISSSKIKISQEKQKQITLRRDYLLRGQRLVDAEKAMQTIKGPQETEPFKVVRNQLSLILSIDLKEVLCWN